VWAPRSNAKMVMPPLAHASDRSSPSYRRLRALGEQLGGGVNEIRSPTAGSNCGGEDAPAELLPIPGWPEGLPMYEFVDVPRFEPGDPAALEHVNEHGYAVISVLSLEECAIALSKFWRFIEAAGHGVRRDDPSSWTDEAWQASLPPTHAEPLWFVRGVPKVAKCWEGLLGTDELLVSFCGAPLNRNWSYNNQWRGGGGSFHVDRGAYYHPGLGVRIPYGLDDRDYIQGTVTLIDNGPHTGGNVVFPRSHKYFRYIAETYHRPMKEQHAYINSGSSLPAAMAAEPDLFGTPIMAKLKAGDAFVWDDRVIHGTCCGKVRPPNDASAPLFRAAVHVTMSPKSLAMDEALETRKLALEQGVSNGHPAHHPIPRRNFESAVSYFASGTKIPAPPLNTHQMSLVA